MMAERRLTFEEAVAHIGGEDNLISEHGRFLIARNARQYLWKYPDKLTWCTACGRSVEGFVGRHGQRNACPRCAATCEFRYEARGHKNIRDKFYLYEWRKSLLDPEALVLTAAIVFRDSAGPRPHEAPLHTDPTALYLFRPERPVAVFKQRWYWGRNGMEPRWDEIRSVHPEHTQWGTAPLDIVVDHLEFIKALEGTRIGRLFTLLREEGGQWRDLELDAVANCARRPWLEYLYKAGQRTLASELMRTETVPRDTGINPRARKPRELLGLTEGQWYEVRRDGIRLTVDVLRTLRALRELDVGQIKVAEALRLNRVTDAAWRIRRDLLWSREYGPNVCQYLERLPGKARRKILRRILSDIRQSGQWRDYYHQLDVLGQVPTDQRHAFTEADMALLLPRDMPEMHRRMTERQNAIARQKRLEANARLDGELSKRLAGGLRTDYTFAAAGLILRPYESTAEVIDEGAALHICIGNYAERYTKGDTVICCLRQANEPDEPWRAVEFTKSGKLVQDRGMYNDGHGGIPPGVRAQLRLFWAAWDRAHRKRKRTA